MRERFNALFEPDGSVIVSPSGITLQFDTREEFWTWVRINKVKEVPADFLEHVFEHEGDWQNLRAIACNQCHEMLTGEELSSYTPEQQENFNLFCKEHHSEMQRLLINIVFKDRAYVVKKLLELAETIKDEHVLMNTFASGNGQHGHCIICDEQPHFPILYYKDV